MSIRLATPGDLPGLLNLEAKCWHPDLRASESQILDRITKFPAGNFLLEEDGQLCGILYTQRIDSIEELLAAGHRYHYNLRNPLGSMFQLIAINVDTDKSPHGANKLRKYALETASSDDSVDRLVAVTRCSDFALNNAENYEENFTR